MVVRATCHAELVEARHFHNNILPLARSSDELTMTMDRGAIRW